MEPMEEHMIALEEHMIALEDHMIAVEEWMEQEEHQMAYKMALIECMMAAEEPMMVMLPWIGRPELQELRLGDRTAVDMKLQGVKPMDRGLMLLVSLPLVLQIRPCRTLHTP